MLSRSPVLFNLFKTLPFGLRHQPIKKDPGGDSTESMLCVDIGAANKALMSDKGKVRLADIKNIRKGLNK
jgi:hypothetical protein